MDVVECGHSPFPEETHKPTLVMRLRLRTGMTLNPSRFSKRLCTVKKTLGFASGITKH